MNNGFFITVSGRKIALFSLSLLPEDKSRYLVDGSDLIVFITPSEKYDFKASVYDTSLCLRPSDPDAFAAIGIFFLKIRGLPLPEVEIEYNGAPVRIKLAFFENNLCALSLTECKLLSTKTHTSKSGVEVVLTTAILSCDVYLRLMRTERSSLVKGDVLCEFNYIKGLSDTLCSLAYSIESEGVNLVLSGESFFSSAAALSALEWARYSGGSFPRTAFYMKDRHLDAEVLYSGEVRLYFEYSFSPLELKEG